MEDQYMEEAERKILEDAAKAARVAADEAHEAAANATEDDDADALQATADDLETKAQDAQAAFDAAVAAPEGEEGDEEDIDFEKELAEIEGGGKQPPVTPAPAPAGEPKTELEKAKRALHFNAKRLKELGGDPAEVLGTPITPVTPAAPVTPVTPPAENLIENLAEMEAAKYARTDAERKVIMHHYRTSIRASGNVVTDIQNAYMIAHKGRIQRSFDEIRRSAGVRPMVATPAGRRPKVESVKTPELSKSEQGIMRQRGFKQNADGTWESKGYIMKYDAKAKGFVTTRKASRK